MLSHSADIVSKACSTRCCMGRPFVTAISAHVHAPACSFCGTTWTTTARHNVLSNVYALAAQYETWCTIVNQFQISECGRLCVCCDFRRLKLCSARAVMISSGASVNSVANWSHWQGLKVTKGVQGLGVSFPFCLLLDSILLTVRASSRV